MKIAIRVLLFGAILASFVCLSLGNERLDRVRRAKGDDDGPSQEDVDAVRLSLDRRPKVARPSYRRPIIRPKKVNAGSSQESVFEIKAAQTPAPLTESGQPFVAVLEDTTDEMKKIEEAKPASTRPNGSTAYGIKEGRKSRKTSNFKNITFRSPSQNQAFLKPINDEPQLQQKPTVNRRVPELPAKIPTEDQEVGEKKKPRAAEPNFNNYFESQRISPRSAA